MGLISPVGLVVILLFIALVVLVISLIIRRK